MALFNKKKTQTPAAPSSPSAGGPGDDFSDFSPAAVDAAADTTSAAAGKKSRKAASKGDKKAPSGRAIKPGVAIGLNIGNDSIKAIELQAKGNEMTITGMGMVATPAESISNGVVMSANALVAGIREVLAQAGIKSKKVVTSVSGTGALVVRIIEVPKMSDGELEDNMKMDLDRYIPFPPSEVEKDFRALRELPSDPDSPNMEVLLAAAQREVIDLHVQVLQDAKLDPRSIDVEPLAAARALTHPLITGPTPGAANGNGAALDAEVDYNDVAAILNIGASGTEISILRGDILVFTRTVPTGGNTVTQSLVDTLGLAWSDAEQLKREMGDALPPSSGASPPYAPTSVQQTSDWTQPAVADEISNAGESWDDFDVDSTTENSAPDTALADNPADLTSDLTSAAPAGGTSADPFADDFYEQGPDNIRKAEPGEQHQQKQPDDASSNSAGSPFSFDETDETGELPTFEESSVGTEGIAASGSTLDDGDEAVLPSAAAAQTASPTPNPVAAARAGSTPAATEPLNPFFDFGHESEPEDKLPTLKDGSPVSFADFLTPEEDDFSALPTLREDSPGAAAVPSAFEFPVEGLNAPGAAATPTSAADDMTDSSLPTFGGEPSATEEFSGTSSLDPNEESLLPSESKTAPDANAFSFSFEDSLIAAPAPVAPAATPAETAPVAVDPFAEFMATAEPPVAAAPVVAPDETAGAAPSTPSAASTPASADDFDLDSLFGDTAANAGSNATIAADNLDFDGLDLGGDDFTMDDAAFGVGLGGASVGEIDAQTLHSVLEPVLDNLINEVRRSLEYHTTRYPEAAVRRIVLTGGGAKLKNLDAFFTQRMGISTTVGNPLSRLNLRAPSLPPGYVDENGPLFTVALGLAMRELTR